MFHREFNRQDKLAIGLFDRDDSSLDGGLAKGMLGQTNAISGLLQPPVKIGR